MSTMAMFDLGAPPAGRSGAPKEPAPEANDTGEGTRWTRCGRWRAGCGNRVDGRDPMRTCATCQGAGAPVRVPWEEAKPDNAATVLPEIVMTPLANAHLSELALHVADDPREDVADFTSAPAKQGMPVAAPAPEPVEPPDPSWPPFACGHPRTTPPPYGFCGVCNRPRL